MKKTPIIRISWRSEIVVAIVCSLVFLVGFYIGQAYYAVTNAPFITFTGSGLTGSRNSDAAITAKSFSPKLLNNVTFMCPGQRFIAAQFLENPSDAGSGYVDLELSDGRAFSLPQAISADGGRYSNSGESFVFWNKGKGAFIEENGTTTWSGCVTK